MGNVCVCGGGITLKKILALVMCSLYVSLLHVYKQFRRSVVLMVLEATFKTHVHLFALSRPNFKILGR